MQGQVARLLAAQRAQLQRVLYLMRVLTAIMLDQLSIVLVGEGRKSRTQFAGETIRLAVDLFVRPVQLGDVNVHVVSREKGAFAEIALEGPLARVVLEVRGQTFHGFTAQRTRGPFNVVLPL